MLQTQNTLCYLKYSVSNLLLDGVSAVVESNTADKPLCLSNVPSESASREIGAYSLDAEYFRQHRIQGSTSHPQELQSLSA